MQQMICIVLSFLSYLLRIYLLQFGGKKALLRATFIHPAVDGLDTQLLSICFGAAVFGLDLQL